MVCVGIDVAKDKHDCFILNSDYIVIPHGKGHTPDSSQRKTLPERACC